MPEATARATELRGPTLGAILFEASDDPCGDVVIHRRSWVTAARETDYFIGPDGARYRRYRETVGLHEASGDPSSPGEPLYAVEGLGLDEYYTLTDLRERLDLLSELVRRLTAGERMPGKEAPR